MKKIYKYSLLVILLFGILLPAQYLPYLQQQFPSLQAREKGGVFDATPRPRFWLKHYLNKSYQKSFEQHIALENPAAPFFVRLRTQIDVELFGQLPKGYFLQGKEGHLFSQADCESTIGRDFIGRDSIETIGRKLAAITDYFSADNIPFLLLLTPAKSRMYPSLMPDYYLRPPIGPQNSMVFLDVLKEMRVPLIDFSYLKQEQDKTPYPIYSPAGMHWSRFGLGLVVDSLQSRVGELTGMNLPEPLWRDSIIWDQEPKGMDIELMNGSNFFIDPPVDSMPYPVFRFTITDQTSRPRVLVIGDSFYKMLYEQKIHQALWEEGSNYWFYFNTLFPPRPGVNKEKTDWLAEIRQQELVLLVCYDTNLPNIGFGFIEKLYDLIRQQ